MIKQVPFSKIPLLSLTLGLSACNPFEPLITPFGDTPAVVERTGSSETPQPVAFLSKPSLAVEEDLKEVSGEFTVQFAGNASLVLEVPLDKSLLPAQVKPIQFQLERLINGQWQRTGFLDRYDASTGKISFQVQADSPGLRLAQESVGRYRIRIYLLSNQVTVSRPGSPFKFHYYPSRLGYQASVKSDSAWNSSSGHATDPNVPDYIEDLDAAMNEAYRQIRVIRRSNGEFLFKQPTEPMDVYVHDTGANAGDSDLGGPISISSTKLKNYLDMKVIGGHELIHLLQSQYYALLGAASGRKNRAFIESSAHYLSIAANGLSPEERKNIYAETNKDYLSVSLTTATDDNMYSSAHFFDWLSREYSHTVIPDSLAYGSRDDHDSLSAVLQKDEGISLVSAYKAYGEYLMSHPEDTGGFGSVQKGALSSYATQQGFLSSNFLRDGQYYSHFNATLPPLSMSMAIVRGNSERSSLLVARAQPQTGVVSSQTYFFSSSKDSDYAKTGPADSYFNFFSGKALTQADFGFGTNNPKVMEQLLINPSRVSAAKVEVDYYLLQAQDVTSLEDGKVSWSNARIAGIPERLLKGFRVFIDGGVLEGAELVPLSAGNSFSSPLIRPDHRAQISVVDLAGNVWPERPSGNGPQDISLSLSPASSSLLLINKELKISPSVIGTELTEVNWELISEFPENPVKGRLRFDGNDAIYVAPNEYVAGECVVARVKAKPSVSRQVCIGVSTVIDTVCVLPDTPITLSTGAKKPIQALLPGDRILAWDSTRKEVQAARVDEVLKHSDKPYTVEQLRTLSGQNLTLTDNHPIATPSGWKRVNQLKAGDLIYLINPITGLRESSTIASIVKEARPANLVYNLKTTLGNYIANDILVHNKCLAADAQIETPTGLRAIKELQLGDQVWGQVGGKKQAVKITALFEKQTVLPQLPGKRLSPELSLTDNHRLQLEGVWQAVGKTAYPARPISGPVYDLETESGNLWSQGFLLEAGYEVKSEVKSEVGPKENVAKRLAF